MGRICAITILTFLIPAIARAGLNVTLIPTPDRCPYEPGQVIRIDVYGRLTPSNGSPSSLPVEFLRFDFTDTDEGFPVDLLTTHTETDHGEISFWNFGTIAQCAADSTQCGAAYSIDDTISSDTLVEIALSDPGTDLAEQLLLHQDRSTLLGSFEIHYPLLPGTYLIDVLNADEADPDHGAELRGDGVIWRAADGAITGGQVRFPPLVCIPEPAGLALLLLGSTLSIARRRNRTIRYM